MKNLTEKEIAALGEEFNLTDGHAYRPWSAAEAAIIDSASDLFRNSDRRDRKLVEDAYFAAFLAAAHQSYLPDYFQHSLCFTASTALEVVANLLRLKDLSLALIEPCFDNLYDIVARHGVRLSVFPEELMIGGAEEMEHHLLQAPCDAIMLVSPNNPTGISLSAGNLTWLANFCRREGKVLVIDATFRFYLPEKAVCDQYAILAASGCDCIVIEDTGKTWPTLEIKAPFFSVSPGLATEVAHIYSDFLLHVSPFAVKLLTRFVQLPSELGIGHLRRVIAQNRAVLLDRIKGTGMEAREAPFMSVSWLRLAQDQTAEELCRQLASNGVYALTGNQFFWSNPMAGDQYLRVALSRDTLMFERAATIIGQVCQRKGERNDE